MKVNGIELLQIIKDGKVPYNTRIEVNGGTRSHYPYVVLYKNNRLYWEWENVSSVVLTDELLEYYFEIPKPPAEIEKLEYEHNFYTLTKFDELKLEIDKIIFLIRGINESIDLSLKNKSKINELIDAVNELRNEACGR